jgi:hypothetical protein
MKIGGVELNGPCEEVLVLPRLNTDDIVIKARAVMDMDAFDAICPEPKAPGVRKKGGFAPNLNDKTYLQQVAQRDETRFAYMVIKSLEPSEIEWEQVDMDRPNTWPKWSDELKEGGLSATEVNRVVGCVMQANSLDEAKLKEARELFLHGPALELGDTCGPDTEPESTPSGEPVKGSE